MDQELNTQEGNTLFIKGLPVSLTADQLETSMAEYGPVRRAFIVNDRNGNSRGFGYVEFAIPEDAQEAASKMNKKNLYGSVISVEIAKPKKKSMRIRSEDSLGVGREEVLKSMNKEEQVEGKVEEEEKEEEKEEKKEEEKEEKKEEEKEKDKSTYSDKLQDKTIHRLQTVLVFGLPPQMKPENIRKKYKVFSFFTYRFPCPAPFNGRDMVAEITVKDSKQIKDVIKVINEIEGLKAIRLSSIPSTSLSFEHCRLIVRNMPFSLAERDVLHLFSTIGPIHSITIPKKNERGTGFIFVQYYTMTDAEACIQQLNNTTFRNRVMIVDWSVNKNEYKKILQKKEEDAEEDEDNAEDGDNVDDNAEDGNNAESNDDDNAEDGDDDDNVEDVEDGDNGDNGDDVEAADEDANEDEEMNDTDTDKPAPSQDAHIHPVIGDAEEGKTIFVRNLSFDCKERDLYQYFSKYGKIIYVKIVRDKVTGISKGTCFIKFETTDSVQRILTLYKRLQNQYSSEKNSTDVNTESLLLDDNRFILNGRPLYLSLALSSSSLQHEIHDRDMYNKDKRHLYLMKEGEVYRNTEAAIGVPEKDMVKRENNLKDKKTKLKNPLFFISPTRLAIKNLGEHIDANKLKKICLRATQKGLANHIVDLNEGDPSLRTEKTDKVQIVQSVISTDRNALNAKGKPKHRGIGFVEFSKHHHALACLRILNNNPTYWWLCLPPKEGEEYNDLNDHKTRIVRQKPEGELSRPIVEFAICNHALLHKKQEIYEERQKSKKEIMDQPLSVAHQGKYVDENEIKNNKIVKGKQAHPKRQKKPYRNPFASTNEAKQHQRLLTSKVLSRATGSMKRKAGNKAFDRKKTRI